MPGAKQAWPTVAACWSPAMPMIGIAAPNRSGSVMPNAPEQSRTSGRTASGCAAPRSSSASQSLGRRCRTAWCARRWWRRSRARGRRSGARAGSCRWCRRRARRARPPAARPARGRAARRAWCRRSRRRRRGRCGRAHAPRARRPPAGGRSRRCADPARRSRGGRRCPVPRSHSTVVSRWLVMPMAAISVGGDARPPRSPAGRPRACRARCPPGRARPSRPWESAARSSFCPVPTARPSRSNTMARLLVVPWSIAST